MLEICHVSEQLIDTISILRKITINPQISLGSSYCILIAVLNTPKLSAIKLDWHECSCATNETHVLNSLVRSRIKIHVPLSYCSDFAEVVKLDIFVTKEFFEDVRMLELCSHSIPHTPTTSHVYCVVDETKLFVRCLVLEIIPITIAKLLYEINDLSVSVRNLN